MVKKEGKDQGRSIKERSIPLEEHGRERGIEDEGGAWPTDAKGVRKIQSDCQ